MATTVKEPETIVRDFCATWPERNVEKLLGYFTDDALYHNMLSDDLSSTPPNKAAQLQGWNDPRLRAECGVVPTPW